MSERASKSSGDARRAIKNYQEPCRVRKRMGRATEIPKELPRARQSLQKDEKSLRTMKTPEIFFFEESPGVRENHEE